MTTPITDNLEDCLARLEPPVLIVSTRVGRGMYTLGEALRERLPPASVLDHVVIEDHLPDAAVTEDLRRYQFISNRLPWLLYVAYKLPLVYYRKYLRETRGRRSDLTALQGRLAALGPRTVLAVSHRPAFWVSCCKQRFRLPFQLWGALGEYGDTLGWRYIFWDAMDGFLSPLARHELSYGFPDHLRFERIELPARRAYARLANQPGDPGAVLLVCGYWGQGPIVRVLRLLLAIDSTLRIDVICGENAVACRKVRQEFSLNPNVRVHGVVPSLLPFLAEAACVVTKPGISTLLEAHAAGRKIFLLKGMPVAEDNNARFAVKHFGAEWLSRQTFAAWNRPLSAEGERTTAAGNF